jgi:hypothetical protein
MGQRLAGLQGSVYRADSALEVTVCTCGVLFALPAKMLEERRRDGKRFYCPHGHSLVFRETEEEKLRRQLEWAREDAGRAAAARDQAEAHLRGERAAKTRIKNQRDRERTRVAGGVCPCCNRTFKNLARHMAGQHPDFGPEDDG